ncbi:hypothetical protein [Streptomyces sp. NPDC051162]|uniref:hypothetical protein n=1 Tax=Streptomyces sp. NPDC051162 TaxID=3154747 RepID=UPI003449AB54
MDAHGPLATRFPLIARPRPACLPLPDRVQELAKLADQAQQQQIQGLASTVYNQAALLASDLALPDLARELCLQHVDAYLDAYPLPAMSAIRCLEPVVNLARLYIRAGHPDDGLRHLLDLYEAVSEDKTVVFDSVTVPVGLVRTAEDRHEVRAWLWRVLLADGTRTLTGAGHWREALTHIEKHRGVGTRMFDGRQVAVIAALTTGNTQQAADLLAATAPGDPWEHVVTTSLTALCRRATGQLHDQELTDLVNTYLHHKAEPGATVFDLRLGLTVLDTIGTEHPAARRLVAELAQRTETARDGYAARELLAYPPTAEHLTKQQAADYRDLVHACALGAGTLPTRLDRSLSASLCTSEAVIRSSLSDRPEEPTEAAGKAPSTSARTT